MDAQQQLDEAMAKFKLEPGSKERVEALLKKRRSSSTPEQSTAFDPIASAMRQHPGLTEEQARQDAEDLGF
jgi:hypothetical protein